MKKNAAIFIISLIIALLASCQPATDNNEAGQGSIDLTISGYHIVYTGDCAWGGPGETTVTINNSGTEDAGPFSVEVNGNRTQVAGVPAGSSTTATLTFNSGPIGGIEATADIDEEVSETDETNNSYMILFTPPPPCEPAGQADLTVAFHRITYTGECAWGMPGEISVQINNLGVVDAGSFQVDINGTISTVPGIPAGGNATATAQFDEGPIGSIEIIVDPNNELPESDEANNIYMLLFTPPPECDDI